MAVINKQVDSAGKDYTSAAAWEAAMQGDYDTAAEIRQAEFFAFTDTIDCIIDGSITSADYYPRLYTNAAARHAGKWDGTKYNITVGTDFKRALRMLDDYGRFEGLQIYQNGTGASAYGAMEATAAATSGILIESCILRTDNTSTHDSNGACLSHGGGSVTLRTSKVIGGKNGVYTTFSASAPTFVAQNSDIVASRGYGSFRGAGTPAYTNCYNGGHATDSYSGAFSATTCAHSSATVYAGSTANVAYSTANFVNVTAGSEDLHLVAGSALLDVGTDLSATFTLDIDGQTFTAPWPIGVDAITSSETAVARTIQMPLEALRPVAQARPGNIESLAGISAVRSAMIESLYTAARAAGANIETLQSLAQACGANIESLYATASATGAPLESLQSLAQGSGGAIEALQAAAQARGAPLESLADARRENQTPIEALGFVEVAATHSVNLEAAGAVTGAHAGGIEALQALAGGNTHTAESLAGVAPTFTLAIESLAHVARTGAHSIEALASVAFVGTTPVESLLAVAGAGMVSFEALARIARAAQIPIEAILGADVNVIVNVVERVAYFQVTLTRGAEFAKTHSRRAEFRKTLTNETDF